MDKVSSIITSNKSYLTNFLIILIVVEHFPLKDTLPQVYAAVSPILNQVKTLMYSPLIKTLLFVVLVWSCCVKKDMNTFLLLAIFFNTYY